MAIFQTILPLFAIILLGFAAIRTGYVAAEQIRPVGDFVIKIALPALIFDAITTTPLGEAIDWSFVLGYGLASLAVFALGLGVARGVLGMSVVQAGMVGLGMSSSNSGFMGYPIALSVIGDAAAPMLAQCMMVENLVMIPLSLALVDVTGGDDRAGMPDAVLAPLGQVFRNPILVALCAALAVSALGIMLPDPLAMSIRMLSRIAPPIALFVLGGTIASLPLGGLYGKVSVVVLGKLVLHPAAAFLILGALPGIDRTTLTGGVLFAAVPMLSIYPLFGQRVGIQMLSATALLTATVVSFATITIVLTLLGGGAGGVAPP